MNQSLKSDRRLQQLGVLESLRKGALLAFVGPVYEARRQPGLFLRLVFHREEGVLHVGYATSEGGDWAVAESEPYTLRSLGYYERRVKRLGDYVGASIPPPGRGDEDESWS